METEDIANHIFNWCIGPGAGTHTAKKLARLYVSLHVNKLLAIGYDEHDERYTYWAKMLLEMVEVRGRITQAKSALILAALYELKV